MHIVLVVKRVKCSALLMLFLLPIKGLFLSERINVYIAIIALNSLMVKAVSLQNHFQPQEGITE